MKRTICLGLGAVLVAGVVGCAVDDSAGEDGENDDVVLGGKGDGAFDVTPAELNEMCSMATYGGKSLHDKVGVSSRATKEFEATSTGPDGRRGTSDDVYFNTFEQLDAVKYVGPATLAKMLAYAQTSNRVVDRSQRWHVQSGHAIATQRIGLWGSTPAFAIDRENQVVSLVQTDIKQLVLTVGKIKVDVPVDPTTFEAYQELRLAVDSANAIHVFFGEWTSGNRFAHLVYANGAFTTRPQIAASSLAIAASPGGDIFGLARGERWQGSTLVPFSELHQLNGTPSVEALAANGPAKSDPSALGVGADGLPVIAWFHPADGIHVARRTAPGTFTTAQGPGDPAWTTDFAIATTGGATPTVVVSFGTWKTAVLQVSGSTVVARTIDSAAAPIGAGAVEGGLGVDAAGVVHACGHPRSTATLVDLTIDGTTATAQNLFDGDATGYCTVLTDSASNVHLIYGDSRVYLHAN